MVTLFRRGKVWWIRFQTGGQRVRESLRTENRKVASELRTQREAELLQQRFGAVAASLPVGAALAPEPEPVVVPLPAVRDEYRAWSAVHKRPKTILNDTARLDAFFATVPGKPLAAVTTADVERFLTAAAVAGRSPATLLRHREILHAFWRWAVRQGHCEANVVAPVPRPRLPERDPVFLSLDQVEQLLRAVAGSNVEGPVAVAVFAGLRREELCWLRWEDLELDRVPAILRVRAKTVGGESWQPKTKRDRKVPVSPRLLAVLQKLRERGASGWMFPSPRGCRWDPDNLSADFREVARPKGLTWNLAWTGRPARQRLADAVANL